ncbi:hypothetical protein VTK26DRAFT_9144 [Humicola hyalothermophila]
MGIYSTFRSFIPWLILYLLYDGVVFLVFTTYFAWVFKCSNPSLIRKAQEREAKSINDRATESAREPEVFSCRQETTQVLSSKETKGANMELVLNLQDGHFLGASSKPRQFVTCGI